MKTLFILRHAKSSWENADSADFERTLNDRGLTESARIGAAIRERKIQPDLILSSPAARAERTATLVKEAAQIECAIRFEEKIYEASPHALREILAGLTDEIETVMLVGHNPGLENLIKLLTGELRPMPTAALAEINLPIEKWSDARADCGHLESLTAPKNSTD